MFLTAQVVKLSSLDYHQPIIFEPSHENTDNLDYTNQAIQSQKQARLYFRF